MTNTATIGVTQSIAMVCDGAERPDASHATTQRSAPEIPITAPKTKPPVPAVRARRKKKKNKMMMPAMGLIFLGLAGGGVLQYQNMQTQAQTQAKQKADSIKRAGVLAEAKRRHDRG